MKYMYSLCRSIKLHACISMFLLCLVSYSCGGSDDGISEPPGIPEQILPQTPMIHRTTGELYTTVLSYLPYGRPKTSISVRMNR